MNDENIIKDYLIKHNITDEVEKEMLRNGYYLHKNSSYKLIEIGDIVKMFTILCATILIITFSFKGCDGTDGFHFTETSIEAKISEYARFKGVNLTDWRIGQIITKTANLSENEANRIIMEIIDDAPTK